MKKVSILTTALLLVSIISFAQTRAKAKEPAASSTAKSDTARFNIGAGMATMMDSMGPMMSNMVKSMMEGQLQYYKQPGKVEEFAHLQKQYFDALVKEGFTTDQALKIITADSLLPKASGVK